MANPDFWYIEPEDRVVFVPTSWRDSEGFLHPRAAYTLSSWSDADRRAKGLYRGRYDPPLPGSDYEVATSGDPAIVGTEAIIKRTYRHIPPAPLPSIESGRVEEQDKLLAEAVGAVADVNTKAALELILKRLGAN